MRPLLLLIVLAAIDPQSASAEDRPSTRQLPCATAAAFVAAKGAVLMSTGPITYERVVRDQGFCELESTTSPAYLPTRDVPLCFVGYRCRDPNRGEGRSNG